MVVSPEDAVNNMKNYKLSFNDNWLRRYRFRLVTNFLPHHTTQQKLLDFGCGDGLFLNHLAERGYSFDMVGYDPYYPIDKINYTEHGIKIFKSLNSISGNQFDILCAFEVIEHIKNDEEALLQIRNLLTSQGTLLLTVPSYHFLYSHCDAAVGHYRRYTKSSVIKLLEKTGFSVLHSTYFFSFLIPIAFIFKYYQLVRKIGRKEPNLGLPTDFMNILSTLASMEYKFMQKIGFYLPCGTSILVVARKQD